MKMMWREYIDYERKVKCEFAHLNMKYDISIVIKGVAKQYIVRKALWSSGMIPA